MLLELDLRRGRFKEAARWEAELKQHLPRKKRGQPPPNYGDVPRKHLYKYAAYDGVYTWRLYTHFKRTFEEDTTLKRLFYDTLMPLSEALVDVEHVGVLVDEERRQAIEVEY